MPANLWWLQLLKRQILKFFAGPRGWGRKVRGSNPLAPDHPQLKSIHPAHLSPAAASFTRCRSDLLRPSTRFFLVKTAKNRHFVETLLLECDIRMLEKLFK